MTDEQVGGIGQPFGSWLQGFRSCFAGPLAGHFDNYCRGLLSDLPRKTVEPIALACGTTVRTFQFFLRSSVWDYREVHTRLQHRIRDELLSMPEDSLGTIGVIDETSCVKKGDQTPGVQRQYLGCVGKVDNGIVTVHLGVAKGCFQALLDSDLYLPESWADDRERCEKHGIPEELEYQPKWRIAQEQLIRAGLNGVFFDWLTFDEGYGSKVPFLSNLSLFGQNFVAEVPVSFSVRKYRDDDKGMRADHLLTRENARRGPRYYMERLTDTVQIWRAHSRLVWVDGYRYRLVVAINEATAEVKYFVTNAIDEPLERVLAVAFRRATIEHGFRLAKQEAGLMHFEGRNYTALMRHLTMATVVLGFVSIHTNRLRGEKSGRDNGTSLSSTEHPLCGVIVTSQRTHFNRPNRPDHSLSSTA